MVKEFQAAKKFDKPVLLHVVTRKGKGYEPAVADPSSFHSSSPFNIGNGQFLKKETHRSYSEVFGATAARLVEREPKTIALTAAMPEGTGLNQVQRRFPDNFFDVGIAEQYMFDFAGGLALAGHRPVVGVYSTFLQRAVDQVIHDISLMNLPVLVGLDRAGLVGGDGPTHQGLYYIALLRPVPNPLLLAPRDENQMQHMLYTAFRLKRPAFVRFPKEPTRGVPLDAELRELPLGRAEVLRPGNDGTVLAVGALVQRALEAAERLKSAGGPDLEVVDMGWIKPLDEGLLLDRAASGRPLVTVEDGALEGGFGSLVQETLNARGVTAPRLLRLGVPEELVPLASREELLVRYGLDAAGIAARVGAFLRLP
jgi:1-deoxy-D-xylulose-5-phosphate synthase